MTEIQLGSGSSSSNTHRSTQSSHTLNRRYVERPSNLFIEEAARSMHAHTTESSIARPSRLVNLRIHSSDLTQAQTFTADQDTNRNLPTTITPNVIELGYDHQSALSGDPSINLQKIIPDEAPTEEITSNSQYAITASSSIPAEVNSISTASSGVSSEDLAISIATDYAAANLSVVENNNNRSIDAIAQATSEAIAAIRNATEPEEIAEQVLSLKSFAEDIKANSSAPEILELSATIDKFVDVAMKSNRVNEEVQRCLAEKAAVAQAQAAEKSKLTINKPAKSSTASKTTAKTPSKSVHASSNKTITPRTSTRSIARRGAKATRTTPKLVSQEDQALRKALRSVASMDDEPNAKPFNSSFRKKGAGKRFVLAFFCAVVCIAGVVYFVGSNIPDISVKVAAMQTGIEASYPSYIPRDFSLSDINSENNKITLTFKGPEKASFTLSEEKSSWDSTALLRNFVEPTWQSNYITTHEQGITIYISGANATWVNGGVLYKINADNNSLTKKQLRNIVTSM